MHVLTYLESVRIFLFEDYAFQNVSIGVGFFALYFLKVSWKCFWQKKTKGKIKQSRTKK